MGVESKQQCVCSSRIQGSTAEARLEASQGFFVTTLRGTVPGNTDIRLPASVMGREISVFKLPNGWHFVTGTQQNSYATWRDLGFP